MPRAASRACADAPPRARRYLAFGTATVMMAVGLSAKPDTSLLTWAHKTAAAELAAKEAS
jgi:hypothetical protein